MDLSGLQAWRQARPRPVPGPPSEPPTTFGSSWELTLQPFQRAQADLHALLRDRLGIDAGRPSRFSVGRPVRRDSTVVLPGSTETTVLLGDGGAGHSLGERFEPATWPGPPVGLWAAYGVVLHVERDFAVRESPATAPPAYIPSPEVDGAFWEQAGGSLRAAAARLGLPPWPLQQGFLLNVATMSLAVHHWEPHHP